MDLVVISLLLTIRCIFDKDDSKSEFRGVEKVFGRLRIYSIYLRRHNSVVRYQEVGRLTARRESHTNFRDSCKILLFYRRKLYRS